MLKNIIYMIVGAVIMFAMMTLLQPQQPKTPPVPASAISSGQVEDTGEERTSLVYDSGTDGSMTDITSTTAGVPDRSAQRPQHRQMNDEVATALVANKTQRLKSRFRQLLNSSTVKADQLTELANEKLVRDMDLMRQSVDRSFSDQDHQLMRTPDTQLSSDEFERKQQLLMQQDELRDQREESRIEFEDRVRNLLTDSELDAFRQQERDTAKETFIQRAEMWSNAIKAGVSDLNDYQLSEIDRITQRHRDGEIESVPIGSTIGSDFMFSTSDNSALGRLVSELQSVLSEQQQTEFESQPVILAP